MNTIKQLLLGFMVLTLPLYGDNSNKISEFFDSYPAIYRLFDEQFDLFDKNDVATCIIVIDKIIPLLFSSIKDDVELRDQILSIIYARRAECMLRMGNSLQALKDCEYALFHCENNSEAYYIKGLTHRSIGDNKLAHECFALGDAKRKKNL